MSTPSHLPPHRRAVAIAAACAAGLALAAIGLAPASAQGSIIQSLSLSKTDQAKDAVAKDSLAIFPASTASVYALVAYEGARNQDVTVYVIAPGNIQVFKQGFKLQGGGTKAYAISGEAMYGTVIDDLTSLADGARENAGLVRSQARGQKDFADLVQGSASGLVTGAKLLGSWSLGDQAKAAAADLAEDAQGLLEVAREAGRLPSSESDKYKGLADDMLEHLDLIDDQIDALDAAKDDAAGLPIAPTDADLGTGYTVKVEVDRNPAQSTEFWVTDKPIATPTTTEPAPPTRVTSTPPSGTPRVTQPAPGTAGARPTSQVGTTPRATAATAIAVAANEQATRNPGAAATNIALLDATPVPIETRDAELMQSIATWTPLAGGANATPDDSPTSPGGSSNSIAVLGLGILALGGLAWWLRRRV